MRMEFLYYMRSELYKISLNGGSLISPLFTWPFYTDWVDDPEDLQAVMFGKSIRVDFSFSKPTSSNIERKLPPGTCWVNITTWDTITRTGPL